MDKNTLSHTTWECKYHLVFAPKFRSTSEVIELGNCIKLKRSRTLPYPADNIILYRYGEICMALPQSENLARLVDKYFIGTAEVPICP